ncbi:transcriptional regulator/antitoxin, MazE [Thermosinus carboxydivorans Nor1]|uniref:Transcriptional regulator/antitoxin, MazE n=1 Tax=Thermosinus carboxydivorans Nor1 TaxID=401526 RepID=A1HMA4_9FIRM|nr:AbrB/MazE/SpoVT family DNA-binding domain-containing protein [Thermosinus carboxydivorans]EAX49045.1 transcriptional regulator/antitoxin, MazE [Thermosinus carboxydivorans Nor1]
MEIDIIRIGNSKGIRLPASLLKQCGIDKKVVIKVDGNKIILTPARAPRQGWEEAFKKAVSRVHEDDHVIYDDTIDLDMLEEKSTNV